MWQDIVFLVGGAAFAAFLIPQAYEVWHGKSMSIWSSGLTGITLICYAYAYYTLNLFFAAETSILTAAMWLFIAIGSWWNRVPNRIHYWT